MRQDQQQPLPRDTMMHHEVHVRYVQRHFLQSVCSCGWLGAARRSPSLAAEEGQDHAILFDGAFTGISPEGGEHFGAEGPPIIGVVIGDGRRVSR